MEGIINFEDFAKIDLRVGEIKEVEEIADADKLWKLSVDLGEENLRTICAGIKKYYSKEDLLNKKIVVVSNLAPRKMRGVESQGMLLAALDSDKKNVVLISPDTLKGTSEEIENGSKVS
jgi:methionyl-tRNA synthetase